MPLAIRGQGQVVMGGQGQQIASQQQPGVGGQVASYPNRPGQGQPVSGAGQGGMVQQYPTNGGGAAPTGQQGFGDGSRGVMVAQFPNGAQPPNA
jgi:hypothetical protein